jgi:hypothetical protein
MFGQEGYEVDRAGLELFVLSRLGRFARLASEADGQRAPEWRRLAGAATFSAYLDCTALGLERRARAVLASTLDTPAVSA